MRISARSKEVLCIGILKQRHPHDYVIEDCLVALQFADARQQIPSVRMNGPPVSRKTIRRINLEVPASFVPSETPVKCVMAVVLQYAISLRCPIRLEHLTRRHLLHASVPYPARR